MSKLWASEVMRRVTHAGVQIFGGYGLMEEYPAARHGNAGTLGFVDGHVEMKRWVDPRTLIPVTGSIWHPVVNHFGSPDYHYVCLRSHKLQPLYPFSDDF